MIAFRVQSACYLATVTAHALPPAAVVMLPVFLPLPNIRALVVPAAYYDLVDRLAASERIARMQALRDEAAAWQRVAADAADGFDLDIIRERRQRDAEIARARWLTEQRMEFRLDQISREIDP